MKNISIQNLMFIGRADTDTFTQYVHLLYLSAVSNVDVIGCYFINFRGDGIYLAGNSSGNARHNENISILNCSFDCTGSQRNNRNGISIIDGVGVTIDQNSFKECSRFDMPGAIDMEPNPGFTFSRLRDIKITNNDFQNIGGSSGAICANFGAQTLYTWPITGLVIANNSFRNGQSLNDIMLICQGQAAQNTASHDVVISDNHMSCGNIINTVTITIASPGVFTTPAPHGLTVNDGVFFNTTGALPTGVVSGTLYSVISTPSATTFTVGTGGTPLNTSGTQSGTHTMYSTTQRGCMELDGIKGAKITGNYIRGHAAGCVQVGYTYNSHNLHFYGNTFKECGYYSGRIFDIYRGQYVYLVDNVFDNNSSVDLLRFNIDGGGTGASDHIYTISNNFMGSFGNFSTANASHTTSPSSNQAFNNDWWWNAIPTAHWYGAARWFTQSKSANQAVINSATLVNDTDLQIPMFSGGKYRIRGTIFFDTTANGDFKYTFIGPSMSLVRSEIIASVPGVAPAFVVPATALPSSSGVALTGTGTTGGYITIDMICTASATGTFIFQFAQNTATNDTGAITLAGSYLDWAVV
jgi:hypothetical protein